jgi:hypothetical protein
VKLVWLVAVPTGTLTVIGPVMVTVVPAAAEAGVKPLTAGVTAVVIRPIELPSRLVNHNAHSAGVPGRARREL